MPAPHAARVDRDFATAAARRVVMDNMFVLMTRRGGSEETSKAVSESWIDRGTPDDDG